MSSTSKSFEISKYLVPFLVYALSTFASILAFPPFDVSELAFVFISPFVFWVFFNPSFKQYWITSACFSVSSWCGLLIWLRNIGDYVHTGGPFIGYSALILLATLVGCFYFVWLLAVYWVIPRMKTKKALHRMFAVLGLAGLWVVLEWVKTFFLYGFPWLPLSVSQWKNPAILQIAAWTGGYGISFLLILFNITIPLFIRHITSRNVRLKNNGRFLKRLCPEFYFTLGCLLLAIMVFVRSWPAKQIQAEAFEVCVIQPNIPQLVKWDIDEATRNWSQLNDETLKSLTDEDERPLPELFLWPEAITPTAVDDDPVMRQLVEETVDRLDRPILMGNLSFRDNRIYNGIFVVEPEVGLKKEFYAKRKLVPFGEFIPLRKYIPFGKNIFTGWDVTSGDRPGILEVNMKHRSRPKDFPMVTFKAGTLVCYEDVFPNLARETVKAGADFLFVATNNSWFGEEGAAYQHAAHSVLRAVETRRPVIRCGNAGWSGWIDEFGMIRDVLEEDGTIYTKGYKTMKISRYLKYLTSKSFYVQHGDWFIFICAFFAIRCFVIFRKIIPDGSGY